MNDYKELIATLRNYADTAGENIYGLCVNSPKAMTQAADAIEQLVNDRNASVDALKALVENIDALPTRSGHWLLKFHDEETEEAIRLIIALCAEQNGTEVSE